MTARTTTRSNKLNLAALAIELPAKITAEWLRSLGACPDAVKIFRKRWPKGAPVTPATVTRAAALKLDINWLTDQILTATAWKAYQEATAPALIKILWK